MILFTGGKTAGHIYPLVSLIKEIDKKYLYIGYKDSLEEKICAKEKLDFIGLSFKKNKYISAFSGYFELNKKLKGLKIDCVISTGGYVSVSTLIYAYVKDIPLYLIEENVIMGRVNKLFCEYAKNVFLVYELEKMKKKYIVTGLPIRKIKYKELNKKYDVLIIGGSLGSRPLCDISEYLSRNFKVCLIAGKYYKNYVNYANLDVIEYTDNIYDYMKSSKVVISRAGSSTTYEIMTIGVPLIVCPSEKTKDNHQYLNALYLLKNNACKMVREEDLRNNLLNTITSLINNDNVRINMISSQKKLIELNSSRKIINIINGDIK